MSSSPAEYSIAPIQNRDPFRDRRPPYSEDAEQAVLSAMLIDGDAVLKAVEHVDASMFYAERHRRIPQIRFDSRKAGRKQGRCTGCRLRSWNAGNALSQLGEVDPSIHGH